MNQKMKRMMAAGLVMALLLGLSACGLGGDGETTRPTGETQVTAGIETTAPTETTAPVETTAPAASTEPEETTLPPETTAPPETEPEETIQISHVEELSMDLGEGLMIQDIGSYTGVFMEDGSDEIVSRVLMIVVKNTGDRTLQYAEITLEGECGTANFTVSTLLPGASCVLLELDRMEYPGEDAFTASRARNVAFFQEEPTMCADKIEIQTLNGAMNITNVSGEEITGDVVVYYKNSSSDMFYGGITYRVRITGGMQVDEIKQIISDHFSATGSTILFVTCG